MNKDNILFTIIGLLIGLIVGFLATNSYNRDNTQTTSSTVPPTMSQGQTNSGAAMPGVSEALEKADKEPENFEAQVKAGEMFARINNMEKAKTYFDRAYKLKPDDYQLLVVLGNLSFDAQKWDEAGTWYEKALAKNNSDISVRTDYGITFMERPNPDVDRAIKEFQTALASDSKHEPSLYNLALAYFKKGNMQEAQNYKAKLSANAELTKKLDSVFASK